MRHKTAKYYIYNRTCMSTGKKGYQIYAIYRRFFCHAHRLGRVATYVTYYSCLYYLRNSLYIINLYSLQDIKIFERGLYGVTRDGL
jgi:hypothetical protein